MFIHPSAQFEKMLNSLFQVGLLDAESHLNKCRLEFGLAKFSQYDNSLRLDRTQELLFAAVSLTRPEQIHKILEIGTFTGESTIVLRALFDFASITTIDLPEPYLVGGEIAEERNIIKSLRQKNITSAKAELILKDSRLIDHEDLEKYDLIWLDGDHSLPTVEIDLKNAMKTLNDNGILIMDDICKHLSLTNLIMRKSRSNDAWKVLKRFSKSFGTDYLLFPKKLNYTQYSPGRRRFMAIMKKK